MGHGAAEVTLQLQKDTFAPGESIRGELVVRGGVVAQHIDGITAALIQGTEAMEFGKTIKTEVIPVEGFEIAPKEARSFPFAYTLPPHAEEDVTYYLLVNMEMDGVVHDYERKRIHIIGEPAV
ncbi:sporulation protein [Ectobacillus sp. JY-23]|uniref:sporulation protein n=1 Tax=Ectobacillus sp. JY-23 TaxID=2933872 RepID=UPI00248B54E2|nr:sporulation protein [Ectobacillus sp. JY-23]